MKLRQDLKDQKNCRNFTEDERTGWGRWRINRDREAAYLKRICIIVILPINKIPEAAQKVDDNTKYLSLSHCIFPKCCQIAPRNLRLSWIQYEWGDFYTRTTACSKYFLYCQVCTWMRGLWNEGNRPMTKLRWRAAAEAVSIQPLGPRRDPTYLFVLAPMPSKPICLKPWRTSNSWKLLLPDL